MIDPLEIHYFSCHCNSVEHTLRFSFEDDEVCPLLSAEIFLGSYLPWHKRVWHAAKYILGFKTSCSHFDTWMLDPDDAVRLREMIDKFIVAHTVINDKFSREIDLIIQKGDF